MQSQQSAPSPAAPGAATHCFNPWALATTCREFAATQASVHYADCGAHFLNADRTAIDAALMPDALHPSAAGLEKLAQCIKPLVDLLMRGRPG